MNKKDIKRLFDDFSKLKVLIIGDVMIDSYMWGKVNRISPEAPVPVVAVKEKEDRLGGAANVALNVQALGATPILCSVIGADKRGEIFLDLMKKQKLSLKGILKSRERITTTKTRIISNNHQMLRVDEEVDFDINDSESDQLLSLITYLIKNEHVDVIIFEDYDKGLITPYLIKKVVEHANRKGIPTVVDPKRKNFNEYKGVTLFKPNLKELAEGTNKTVDSDNMKQLQKIVDLHRSRQKMAITLITLSEKGVFVSARNLRKLIPAHVRNVADVSGAGDTVISVAALCLALGCSPTDVATLANLAGGLVCEYVGVVPVPKDRLLKEAMEVL